LCPATLSEENNLTKRLPSLSEQGQYIYQQRLKIETTTLNVKVVQNQPEEKLKD